MYKYTSNALKYQCTIGIHLQSYTEGGVRSKCDEDKPALFNCFKKYNRDAALEMIYSVCVSQRMSAEMKTPKSL